MRWLKKRGVQLNLWTLVSILLLVLLILALFYFIRDVEENTFFERNLLAKDLSLTMNSIQGMPGDVYFNYESNLLNRFNVTFEENRVLVEEKMRSNSYLFYVTQALSDDYIKRFEEPEDLSFTKARPILKIEEGLFSFVQEEECPAPEGKMINEDGIVYLHSENEEAKEELVDNMKNSLDPVHRVYDEIAGSDVDLPVLVALDAKEELGSGINIYYLNNDRNSKALACRLYNEMIERDSYGQVSYYSGVDRDLASEDIDDYVAISIEAGSDVSGFSLATTLNDVFEDYDENIQ